MNFKSKKELEDYLRGRVKELMGKSQTAPMPSPNMFTDKFPELKQALEKLMTSDYGLFVSDIQWISPKPTTFRIIFPNGQFFTLIWLGDNFMAKISGVKYNLLVLREYQGAVNAISELLQYGPLRINLSPEDLANQNLTPAEEEEQKEIPNELQ